MVHVAVVVLSVVSLISLISYFWLTVTGKRKRGDVLPLTCLASAIVFTAGYLAIDIFTPRYHSAMWWAVAVILGDCLLLGINLYDRCRPSTPNDLKRSASSLR